MAVHFEGQSMTYRELDLRATELAATLREDFGVVQGAIVGIKMERSDLMVIALMAVLKAGAAYLPIDPGYPEERVNFLLKDAAACCCIEENNVCSKLTHQPALLPGLAYVIYTSGSTGNPKGVLIDHPGAVNRIHWMWEHYGFSESDIILQKTAHIFDVSVWEFFLPLCFGASLVICPRSVAGDPVALRSLIRNNGVTVIHFVPSMLHAFLDCCDEGKVGDLPSLRCIFASGEALTEDIIRKYRSCLPVPLHNLYGPTEASVDVSWYPVSGFESDPVPIGKPVANIGLHIISPSLHYQSPGVNGEICISGVGLARGYLNRPELTADKFTDVFLSGRMIRLYRTGDMGRLSREGDIIYLGRKDHQVKLNGYRIELGEIERTLCGHPEVSQATVVSGKQLVAFVVAPSLKDVSLLNAYLLGKLPEYMVPARILLLDSLPLTLSGKTDRKALENWRHVSAEEHLYPQKEEEKALLSICEKVLGIRGISLSANFFELGGDSINATQVVYRMMKLGYRITLKDIFRSPVFRDMAALIQTGEIRTETAPPDGPYALSPIQQRFFRSSAIDLHYFNQAVLLTVTGIPQDKIIYILAALQDHHDALRTTFNGTGNQEVEQRGMPVSFQVFDQPAHLEKDQFLDTSIKIVQSGINLKKGPLMKAALIRGKSWERLLLVIHHLVVDGISWRILFEDLEALYFGDPLPPKTDSYKTWVEKMAVYGKEGIGAEEREYWEKINGTALVPLPTDLPVKRNLFKDVRTVTFKMPADYTSTLLTQANKAFNTQVVDLLLAAWGLTLRNMFGMAQLAVDMEGHGREEVVDELNISRTIGWFTTAYPVVISISGLENIGDVVRHIKDHLRMIPFKGIGYGLLNNEICRPSVSFNYLGKFDTDLENRFFSIANEPVPASQSGDRDRDYLIDVSGMVSGGMLEMAISYHHQYFNETTVEKLATIFEKAITDVVDFCCAYEGHSLTPADLGYTNLSIRDVDAINNLFSQH